ncbi:hypothetical protein MASR2M29_04250 [Spirochaetota bacterium]
MNIDSSMLAYRNQAIKAPKARAEGLGAASLGGNNNAIDKNSPLYEQCREFESIFINMMLKEMRSTVQKTGLIDGGQAEDIFSDLLYDEYAKDMAKMSGFGLADAVYLELVKSNSSALHAPES